MTEQYLNFGKLRFDFEFSVSVDKEIDPHITLVPFMLLQPFAENAVIHGLQSEPENRRLKIEILKENTGWKLLIYMRMKKPERGLRFIFRKKNSRYFRNSV